MKHFTMQEIVRSQTADELNIDNTPTEQYKKNIIEMVETLIDPLRDKWAVYCANERIGTPQIRVSSGYRSVALNKAVGGSSTSAHLVGYALDLVPMNGRLKEFKRFCRDFLTNRLFDQVISENEDANGVPQWIHVGYKTQDGRQRGQFLSKVNGKYTYMTR